MPKVPTLEAHSTAPRSVRELQKYYQKLPEHLVSSVSQILDFRDVEANPARHGDSLKIVDSISPDHLRKIYNNFLDGDTEIPVSDAVNVYEHNSMPGLRIIPSLLPLSIQEALLSKLLLRDLSNPEHMTNIHLHYNVPYPPAEQSFFQLPSSTLFEPKDPDVHKPLSVTDVLNKKLRWMTLGGQYNWTTKEYPDGPPVPFPQDIRDLVNGIFPSIEPEAAICNTYSPGDTLSPHRDVSEEADRDLVSISIGCDALFLISLTEETAETAANGTEGASQVPLGPPESSKSQHRKPNRKHKEPPPPPPPLDEHSLIIRIRSGDAVVMGGNSRWAWHGVPKVIGGTCPEGLRQWPNLPVSEEADAVVESIDWTGWMLSKRVNLNIRQMYEHD